MVTQTQSRAWRRGSTNLHRLTTTPPRITECFPKSTPYPPPPNRIECPMHSIQFNSILFSYTAIYYNTVVSTSFTNCTKHISYQLLYYMFESLFIKRQFTTKAVSKHFKNRKKTSNRALVTNMIISRNLDYSNPVYSTLFHIGQIVVIIKWQLF